MRFGCGTPSFGGKGCPAAAASRRKGGVAPPDVERVGCSWPRRRCIRAATGYVRIEVTLFLVVPFAVLAGTLFIMCAECALRSLQPHERRPPPTLRRVGLIVGLLVVVGMGLLWASWARRFPYDAAFAMWGTLLAAGGLLLIALKPNVLRASIGLVLVLIAPALIWLLSTIGSECSRVGCTLVQELSVFPALTLVGLAVVLFGLELGVATRRLLARERPVAIRQWDDPQASR